MNTYRTHPYTEAQLTALDEGRPVEVLSLSAYEKQPATAEILLQVRGTNTPERWQAIARKPELASDEERRLINLVWNTLGGETCFSDACRLVARCFQ